MSGHFSAMQRQLKRNEAAKAARRDAQLKKKRDLLGSKGYSNIKEFDFPEISTKELNRIKSTIRRKIKHRKQKNLVFLIILLSISIFVAFNYIDFRNVPEIPGTEQDNNTYLAANINEYSYLIDDGDQWIEKGNWNNAIYRYEKAVELFPAKYEAKYRLALAYSYHCKYKNEDCEIGAKLTDNLLKYQPDEIDLIQLKNSFVNYTLDNKTTINK